MRIDCKNISKVICFCEVRYWKDSPHNVTHIVRRMWVKMNTLIKGIHLHSHSSHNLLTMRVTLWVEFFPNCASQKQITSKIFSQTILQCWIYFVRKMGFFLKENSSRNGNRLSEVFWGHLLLWDTMWEEFCPQCESHCDKTVRRMWVEMNILNVYFRANFSN